MILLVHGYEGSGPGHWQRWLATELRARGVPHRFPELPAPNAPEREAWLSALEAELAPVKTPVTFVAHSLGCWCVDHLLQRRGDAGIHAALLVSPPAADLDFPPIAGFLPPPRDAREWARIAPRSLLLGSDDDPYAARSTFEALSHRLGVPFECIPKGGHLNVASGFGPFPRVLAWSLAAARASGLSG